MKRTMKFVGAAWLVALALTLVVACSTGSSDDPVAAAPGVTDPEAPPTGTDPVVPPVVVAPLINKGALADWAIALGYENLSTNALLIAEDTANVDPVKGGAKSMKVTFSSSKDFRSCELYATLPKVGTPAVAVDFGQFDGLQFDVKLPASTNFLLLLRNPAGGTTWKVWEDYVYRGTDDVGSYVWVTVKQPFSPATDTGWGPAPTEADLKSWLTGQMATAKQINLNPVLNTGGGSTVNVDQVMYLDNIGFYKTGPKADGTDDIATIAWDFE